jgi:hypothetical protein
LNAAIVNPTAVLRVMEGWGRAVAHPKGDEGETKERRSEGGNVAARAVRMTRMMRLMDAWFK